MKAKLSAVAVALLLALLSATPASSLEAKAGSANKACEDVMTAGPIQRMAGYVATSAEQLSVKDSPDAMSLHGLPIYFERPEDGEWIEITSETFEFEVQVPVDVAEGESGSDASAAPESPDLLTRGNTPTQARAEVCQTLGGMCTVEVVAKASVTTTAYWAFIFFKQKTTAHASFHTNIECGGDFVTTAEHYNGLGARVASSWADSNNARSDEPDACVYVYPTECPTHHQGAWGGSATVAGKLAWYSVCGKTHIVNKAYLAGVLAAAETVIPLTKPQATPVMICFDGSKFGVDDTGVQSALFAAPERLGQQVFEGA